MHGPTDEHLRAAVVALGALEAKVPTFDGHVRLRFDEEIAWLELDNPSAHNAMTVRMMRQLAEAVVQLSEWDGAIVAIRSSHGGSFCSGGHLAQVRQALVHTDAGRTMTDCMSLVLNALLDLDVVSVAILEGAAIGGGAELLTACDLRVSLPTGRVRFAQVPLGVACGWGGAGRLVRLIGRRRALQVVVHGRSLSAVEALDLGLVDAVAEGAPLDLLRAALGHAIGWSKDAVRASKHQVVHADAPDAQARAFLSVWGGSAHRVALGLDESGA